MQTAALLTACGPPKLPASWAVSAFYAERERTMSFLDLIQWPAMLVTITAAWLVASKSKIRRTIGFWLFLLSNALWIIWGWHDEAYALILLQACLGIMNFRGLRNNDTTE
jgi:hypothetical protein